MTILFRLLAATVAFQGGDGAFHELLLAGFQTDKTPAQARKALKPVMAQEAHLQLAVQLMGRRQLQHAPGQQLSLFEMRATSSCATTELMSGMAYFSTSAAMVIAASMIL